MVDILLVLGLCLILWLALRGGSWQRPRSTKADKNALRAYEARENLFVNGAETAFFAALNRHKPAGYHVFSKVRLEDILQVRTDIQNRQARWKYRGRIKSRHVDFLICRTGGAFICAIELDGSAHRGREAHMVDQFKDEIFANAGLKLLRVKTGDDFGAFSRALWAKINRN